MSVESLHSSHRSFSPQTLEQLSREPPGLSRVAGVAGAALTRAATSSQSDLPASQRISTDTAAAVTPRPAGSPPTTGDQRALGSASAFIPAAREASAPASFSPVCTWLATQPAGVAATSAAVMPPHIPPLSLSRSPPLSPVSTRSSTEDLMSSEATARRTTRLHEKNQRLELALMEQRALMSRVLLATLARPAPLPPAAPPAPVPRGALGDVCSVAGGIARSVLIQYAVTELSSRLTPQRDRDPDSTLLAAATQAGAQAGAAAATKAGAQAGAAAAKRSGWSKFPWPIRLLSD